MNATLLFRLEGPMQSWGHRSRFDNRDTGLEPTRSGVIGFVCAALGWGREHDLTAFDNLTMGVRVDRAGRVMVDYHTAQSVTRAGGGTADTVVSRRYYLADACFTVGIYASCVEDAGFLRNMEAALRSPHWPLYLGRRSFPVVNPPCLLETAIHAEELEAALRTRDLVRTGDREFDSPRVLWLETPFTSTGIIRNDVPKSFAIHVRRYELRSLRRDTLEVG